jgi:hypothetical protein
MRKILLTVISFVALSALVACGGGSSNNSNISIPPVPSGGNSAGFSNASLTGNYVYAINGETQSTNFAVVGVFTADGNGNITSGVRDTVNDAGGQTLNESITGSYSINQDGRGQAVINGAVGQVIYRFVLQSTSSLQSPVVGKLFQDGTTSNSVVIDAVGRIEAQTSVTSIGGPSTYVVRLDGEDAALSIYGAVGGLTLSGGGVTGAIDENDAGRFDINTAGLPVGITSGSYSFSGNGRGTVAYVTPQSSAVTTSPQGSHNFVAYFVSPSHFELISTDPKFYLHGYTDLQTTVSANTAAFTGSQVFSISGSDNSGPRVETGQLTLDGAGGVGASAIEDINNASSFFSGVSLAGSNYTVGASGRWTANLVNTPTAGSTTGLVGWQVSPEQSAVLTSNPNVLETGTMRAQTLGLTTANVSGYYAQDLSGSNTTAQNNSELTGNLNADGAGNLTGTYDSQSDTNGLNLDVGTTGTYSINSTSGRSTSGTIDGIPVVIYAVDKNTIYFISAQQFDVYQGMMVSQ